MVFCICSWTLIHSASLAPAKRFLYVLRGMLIAKIPCRFEGKLGPAVWNATSDNLARCVQLHEARDAQLFVER
jgi:hypothetical protein